ncbi:MAG: hypothetical protein KAS71_02075 [Bacteroidales bacterium]|nr:hypothetical protein [Bacteroidales bacterium]
MRILIILFLLLSSNNFTCDVFGQNPRNEGSIDAYLRDDGDEPDRIMMSHSDDEGY